MNVSHVPKEFVPDIFTPLDILNQYVVKVVVKYLTRLKLTLVVRGHVHSEPLLDIIQAGFESS